MATLKNLYGKNSTELACELGCSVSTIYMLNRKGRLSGALKQGHANLKIAAYQHIYGMGMNEIALKLECQVSHVSMMHKLGVLQLALDMKK